MQQWLKEHITLIGMLGSAIVFVFSTFAKQQYVEAEISRLDARTNRVVRHIDDLHKDEMHYLERLQDEMHSLLRRK